MITRFSLYLHESKIYRGMGAGIIPIKFIINYQMHFSYFIYIVIISYLLYVLYLVIKFYI